MKKVTPTTVICHSFKRKSLPEILAIESTVGHLPREIPRLMRFIMLHGAIAIVKILDALCGLPLLQGGLETPIQVIYTENGVLSTEQRCPVQV